MKKIYPILTFALLTTQLIFANGGPVDMSHFRKTGNIRLLRNADVSLLKEDLKIKVVGDYTEIEVEYTLQNNGKTQEIQYGFPVDAYESDWCYGESWQPIFFGINGCLQYFDVRENDEAIKVSQWVVDSLYTAKTINLGENPKYHSHKYAISRKWSAITLQFEQNEVKTLQINYKIKNTLRDKSPGFCFIERYTDRHFTYHLTPSSKWGNGIVNDFSVSIDLSDLASSGCDYSVFGLDSLNNVDNIYTFSMTNYDLKKSDRIHIHYDNRHLKMTPFINEHGYSNNVVKSIRSSSNNATIKNLIDNNHTTTWTGKRGDWIEIEFQTDKIIRGILLLNGDYSNEENFDKSGKMSRAKVIVNDTLVFNTTPWEGETPIIELEKSVYRNVAINNFKGLSTILADGDGLYFPHLKPSIKKTTKIRIEIVGTVDGENGKITLSELFFVGK